MTDFEKECDSYSVDELELIIETQKDLYNDEEMEYLIKALSKKREAIEIERINNLPKEMKCPKCDMVIPIESVRCPFCEYNFGNNNYKYAVKNDEDNNCDNDYDDTSNDKNGAGSGLISYILSFIVPLVGFILGAMLMSKDDEYEKSTGVKCIIIGIVSMIISAIVGAIVFL